jgi:hypothetical protein
MAGLGIYLLCAASDKSFPKNPGVRGLRGLLKRIWRPKDAAAPSEVRLKTTQPIDIGLFAADPDARAFSDKDVIAFEKRRIKSGDQTIEFVVDRKPARDALSPVRPRERGDPGPNIRMAPRLGPRFRRGERRMLPGA